MEPVGNNLLHLSCMANPTVLPGLVDRANLLLAGLVLTPK